MLHERREWDLFGFVADVVFYRHGPDQVGVNP